MVPMENYAKGLLLPLERKGVEPSLDTCVAKLP